MVIYVNIWKYIVNIIALFKFEFESKIILAPPARNKDAASQKTEKPGSSSLLNGVVSSSRYYQNSEKEHRRTVHTKNAEKINVKAILLKR